MPSTIPLARDEILERLNDVVQGTPTPPGPVQLIFDDTPGSVPSSVSAVQPPPTWARVRVQHSTGRQASLSGSTGKRRWERTGFLLVQLFTPLFGGQVLADEIASIILNAFEGYSTSSGVWFRNARMNEIGKDGAWLQTNILVDFQYDEVK